MVSTLSSGEGGTTCEPEVYVPPVKRRRLTTIVGGLFRARTPTIGLGMYLAAPTAGPMAAAGRRRRRITLPFLASGLVGMLAFEFLLGTYLQMFVELPPGGDFGTLPFGGLVVLVLHIVVGLLLIGLCLRMTYVAVRSKSLRGTVLAGLSVLGVVIAFAAGSDFTYGSQAEVMSFAMATGFFIAMVSAAILLASASATAAMPDSATP